MKAPPDPIDLDVVRHIASEAVPHHKAIGTQLVECEPGEITLSLAWREDLVEDPETGAMAGANVSALLDHAGGLSVITRLGRSSMGGAATLDLRVDFLAPAPRGSTIRARCECHAVREAVAYIRGTAWREEAPDQPIATASMTYLLTVPAKDSSP